MSYILVRRNQRDTVVCSCRQQEMLQTHKNNGALKSYFAEILMRL